MTLAPGLLVLHGNRAESLVAALAAWTARHPLAPLESEVFLVQSNGVAEWLKMALAERHGVCAATRVELPARFLWRAYRSQLGRAAVPQRSALDKQPLTWRLMARLPELLARPDPEGVYAPLARFLLAGEEALRYQLAQRLADLYDQYQVYRGDWLEAWAAGQDGLPPWHGTRSATPLPPDQRWQAALWRELQSELSADELAATRPRLHRRFVDALESGAAPEQPLPRRVMLFGMTHVPMQTLEALAALARRSQVLLAIPNPCRYHWADIIDGREVLRAARRRQPLRGGRDLADVPLSQMHAHAHPLLAAWGRQGRDFMRQLDAFDDVDAVRGAGLRVDLYDDGAGRTLLEQVQARIRDLVPLAEHEPQRVDEADRSIAFHIAHGAQREVEVLHDELLAMLAAESTPALQPRDIVVMVPDIETYAPAIRSVFGQYPRGDARRIPYAIADLREQGAQPLLLALEWLLRLPQQRCTLAELRALLEVPALAARFGIAADDLPQLAAWAEGAGVRWGLDAAQRGELGLAACGEANSWRFGLRRMLLGYASGESGQAWGGIEPYAEVGGIEASLAGALAALLDALEHWSRLAATPATPQQWSERLQALLATFFDAADERDRWTLAACGDALRDWLDACDAAHFEAPLALAVVREAWLAGLDEPSLNRRFRAGGVTFCTLLPMRAIPFEVVCLLGMNDGDYPRAAPRSDFDLMGWPGQSRPGDRSRRDDDRQLMLEALLSARRRLYVGWTGRNQRDNTVQPPSVLVAQLRDYLAAGWGAQVVESRTTEHPLQPFSRRYFEAGSALSTQAREWRVIHLDAVREAPAAPPPHVPDAAAPLTTARLARFLKSPVQAFFRDRLGVVLRDAEIASDDEPLVLGGLDEHGVVERVLAAAAEGDAGSDAGSDAEDAVDAALARERRSGALPMAGPGERVAAALRGELLAAVAAWRELALAYPHAAAKEALQRPVAGVEFSDWLDELRDAGEGRRIAIELRAGRVCSREKNRKPAVAADKLVAAWVRMLAAAACGHAIETAIVGRDALVRLAPLPAEDAQRHFDALAQAWREGMDAPLPVALRTALKWAERGDEGAAAAVYDGRPGRPGEGADPVLARCYPDFEALVADGRSAALVQALVEPLLAWAARPLVLTLHGAAGDE